MYESAPALELITFQVLRLLFRYLFEAEIIIPKCRIQERNNVTRVRVERPDYAIKVVVKTTPLPFRPRCQHILH